MVQCPSTLSKDDVFHILQNARRRAVLRYLLDHPDQEEFVMRTVAEAVAAWEYDTTARQLSSEQRRRVYISLYQSHLPKLDEQDLINYNRGQGVIEPTQLIHAVAPYLEEGLHAETVELTAPEDTSSDHSLSDAVSTLLRR